MRTLTVTADDSSTIGAIAYDGTTRELRVTFKGGGTYSYAHVPAELVGYFVGAESLGAFFHRAIRGKFETTKLEDSPPTPTAPGDDPSFAPTPYAENLPNG